MEQLDNHIQETSAPADVSASDTSFQATESSSVMDSSSSYDAPPQANDYDVIRYNKQEIKIPVSERQTYLQKGYNYDKLQNQYQEAQRQAQLADRIAKMQGFDSFDAFETALNEYEQEQQMRLEAEKLGVDESVIRDHLNPLKSELDALKRQNEVYQRAEYERQVRATVDQLRSKYSDFDAYSDQIVELTGKGYELEDAYRLASYADVNKRIEQEIMARIRERGDKQILSSADRGSNQKLNPTHMSLEDIESISARVARGERISF